MAWQTKSSPSRKPRLKGVFKNESMVSDTFNELIQCGLRKLTRDLEDRGQTIFGEIPILFACAVNVSTSPAPSGGGSGGGGGQINLRLPAAPAGVTQGTLLQLGTPGGAGRLRSSLSSPGHYGPATIQDRADQHARRSAREGSVTLPPEPRYAEILPSNDLISGSDIRQHGIVSLFKTEPLLAGKCAAMLMKDEGCIFPNCAYCKITIEDLPKVDTCDLLSALRRVMGTANARLRPNTPRGRSDSVGSDRSVGSQRSDGGGMKPKRPRQGGQ